MNKKYVVLILISILLLFSFGCEPKETMPGTITNEQTEKPDITTALSDIEAVQQNTTKITIDGKPDDWSGRQILLEDPAGDNSSGFLDLRQGYAFVNQEALYILVEAADQNAPFELFDMHFMADGLHLQITWGPGGKGDSNVRDLSGGKDDIFKPLEYSTFAYGPAFEARIDLQDLGNPDDVVISGFMAMADIPGRGWDAVDDWLPPPPAVVDEVDFAGETVTDEAAEEESITPEAVARDENYYTRLWGLPDNYAGKSLLISPVGNNSMLACSEQGTVYLKTWGSEAGVSLIDVDARTVTRLFNVAPDTGMSDIVGGPGETAFISIGPEIRQINPDGTYTIWGSFPNDFLVAYAPDNRLLGQSHDGRTLWELFSDGTKKKIADGFNNIYDVKVTTSGVIVVYEWDTGDVVRLDPDGTKKVLVPQVMPGDFANLGLDSDGQLYLNSAGSYGFKRVDIDTGELTDISTVYNPCVWNPNDFVFIEPGKLILTGDQLSWADLNTGENGILIQNLGSALAADTGPDGALYIGISGCGDQIPARILRISDDGTQTVFFDNLEGVIRKIAFTPDGDLYISAIYDGSIHLLFLKQGTNVTVEIPDAPSDIPMSLAVDPNTGNVLLSFFRGQPLLEYDSSGFVKKHNITIPWDAHEYRAAFAPDGALYAYIGRADNETDGPWLASIDLEKKTCTEIAELPRFPAGGLGAFTVDSQGSLWLYLNPESILYRIEPDGTVTQVGTNLPIDAPAIAVNEAGNIYFCCSAGIFGIFS